MVIYYEQTLRSKQSQELKTRMEAYKKRMKEQKEPVQPKKEVSEGGSVK